MIKEQKLVGGWIDGIKKCAPDGLTVIMRGEIKIKARPSDKEALELLEKYKDKTFGEVEKIFNDAQFWLRMIQKLSFEEKSKEK